MINAYFKFVIISAKIIIFYNNNNFFSIFLLKYITFYL